MMPAQTDEQRQQRIRKELEQELHNYAAAVERRVKAENAVVVLVQEESRQLGRILILLDTLHQSAATVNNQLTLQKGDG